MVLGDDGRVGVTGLDKPPIPIYEPVYDLRVLVNSLKASLDLSALAVGGTPHTGTLLYLLNTMPAPPK